MLGVFVFGLISWEIVTYGIFPVIVDTAMIVDAEKL